LTVPELPRIDNPGETSTSWTLVQRSSRPALAAGAALIDTRDASRTTLKRNVVERIFPHLVVAAKACFERPKKPKTKI
jgi:hypothetical protein